MDDLRELLSARENEHVEFKEAKTSFAFDDVVKYCVAFANEGGGHLVLGVTDRQPRQVVGTGAFRDPEQLKQDLLRRLRVRVNVEEYRHQDRRVLVLTAPSRPIGYPVEDRGQYWMRSSESLVPMSPDQIKQILDEAVPDYSAAICPTATLDDLDPLAIERLRALWHRESSNDALLALDVRQLLEDAELTFNGSLTYAALILLGTRRGLGQHLAQAESIFEYRSSEASIPYQQREELRIGVLLALDTLWALINLRNESQPYRDGLFVGEVRTFDEDVVREALLNALCHRDYRLGGSTFVRQFPRTLEIVSPGGFPPGITAENILDRQYPRNRRVAEVLAKCGLVERSGQGLDTMLKASISQGKLAPDFSKTDEYQVTVVLHGEIGDPRFIGFIERVGEERLAHFTTHDFVLLDLVHREQPIPDALKPRLRRLREHSLIESVGRGRGTRYLLSASLYGLIGERGVYTRKRGLDHETNKALLLKHIRDSQPTGCRLEELLQVLPSLSRDQVRSLLRSLQHDGSAHSRGRARASRWHVGPSPA